MGTAPEPGWRTSPPLQKIRNNLDLPWAYARSALAGRRDRDHFRAVGAYCMFIGYPRSGHSLLGSLIDAHPEAVIAHELDALRYLAVGFDRSQLYSLILENSRRYRDQREIVYDYTVPRQWQGRFLELRVLGDKKGGRSTRRLAQSPDLLHRVERTVGVPVRFVHVVRNPFDNIATIAMRDPAQRGLPAALAEYLRLASTNDDLRRRLSPGAVLELRHEALLERPRQVLTEVCRFLGLDAGAHYLDDCAGILFPEPNRTRHRQPWPSPLRREVRGAISRFEFLQGYSWED